MVNPDGMELVSNWYMREPDRTALDVRGAPAYQKYIGHDNNRDFYMMNQPESEREPDPVSRVVPGDHVRPPPDRTGRRSAVRPAV